MSVMTAPLAKAHGLTRPSRPALGRIDDPSNTYTDPLDEDAPDDEVVVTTRRAISRVALVATETAGRFQREGVEHDPMTWMLAPRALFAGSSAIEACLHREACLRGVLLHGLSLGLDADPAAIDALTDDEDDCEVGPDDGEIALRSGGGSRAASVSHGVGGIDPREQRGGGEEPHLFTATVVANDGFETVHAFHASLAMDEAEIAGRLYMRMGAASADAAIVRGFDQTSPMVEALVSQALCDTLMMVAADPASELAAGLDLNVEQRFYG